MRPTTSSARSEVSNMMKGCIGTREEVINDSSSGFYEVKESERVQKDPLKGCKEMHANRKAHFCLRGTQATSDDFREQNLLILCRRTLQNFTVQSSSHAWQRCWPIVGELQEALLLLLGELRRPWRTPAVTLQRWHSSSPRA